MKKSELKSLISEVIKEIVSEDPNNPLYVEYVGEMAGEEPFMMGDKKFQYVKAKYPNGKTDIGVYAFAGDVVYGYQAFRDMYNLKEQVQGGNRAVMAIINNDLFPMGEDELEGLAKKYQLKIKFVGDSQFGTETMKSYRVLFAGPQGQIDAFVHATAEENGIEFFDVNADNVHEANEMDPKDDDFGVNYGGQGLDEDENNQWKYAQLDRSINDEGEMWRSFARKVAAGNQELANVFQTAVSAAEDNALLKPDHKAVGHYTSDNFIVTVDMDNNRYRIEKLQ